MIEAGGILYLELEDVLLLYAVRFHCDPLEATARLLRRDLLESALVRPRQYAYYYNADIPMQAAALAHGIAESQSFIEGNKRTAGDACTQFLTLNHYSVQMLPQDDVAIWIRDFSSGLSIEEFADKMRRWVEPLY